MITMGNDEFILYIRKWHPSCRLTNDTLGRMIAIWFRDCGQPHQKVEDNRAAYWGSEGEFVNDHQLPVTAAQFEFNRVLLPELFAFLDELGTR